MVMRREVRTADGRFMEPQAREDQLSANDFCATAQRSWQAALRLAAMSSEFSMAQLQSDFNNTNAGANCEAEMHADEDSEDEGTGLQVCGPNIFCLNICKIY